MTTWAVTFDALVGQPLEDDRLGDIVDELADRTAAVAGDGCRLSVTLTIEAAGVATACAAAEEALRAGLTRLEVEMLGIEAAEILTAQEQDRRLAEPVLPRLAGVAELAAMLGVSRQRASALTSHPEAPEPVARLASGPVYVADSWRLFERNWARQPGRPQPVG